MILPNPQASGSRPKPERAWVESLLLGAAALALALSLAFPMWSITLEAPQYPEGLGMHIWARSLKGVNPHDLATINELNHYIGMKKIVPESIPELSYIAPITWCFAAAALLAAWRPRAWSTGLLLAGLAGAGAYGMYDFWSWEYDYGHNLNPMAAIKVPGMSYQPPLLGVAHLLNFESESWPATGGILLFIGGALIAMAFALALVRRFGWKPFARPARYASVATLLCLALAGCEPRGPVPFFWGEDACHFCKMTLVDKGFAAQRINANGKAYKFDSIECLLSDIQAHPLQARERVYVSDRSRPDAPLAEAFASHYLQGGLSSPMGRSLAAFQSPDSASAFQARVGGTVVEWDRLRLQ